MENRNVMEEFAVIGLDTQEKKAEAEAILKELGYRSDEKWNNERRSVIGYQFIITSKNGRYSCHNHDGKRNQITLDQLREKVGKTEPVEKPKYPCMMEVWDYEETNPVKANVISEVEHKGFKCYVVDLYENGDFVVYMNARPIQPDPLKELIEKLKNNSVTLTPNEAQLILDAL